MLSVLPHTLFHLFLNHLLNVRPLLNDLILSLNHLVMKALQYLGPNSRWILQWVIYIIKKKQKIAYSSATTAILPLWLQPSRGRVFGNPWLFKNVMKYIPLVPSQYLEAVVHISLSPSLLPFLSQPIYYNHRNKHHTWILSSWESLSYWYFLISSLTGNCR